jgi:uncharacterized protein
MADPSSRLIALDALRGFAVMGILLMNIISFAMPGAAYLNPAAYGGTGPIDLAAWGLCFVLADGKFRALFSFLFGASMLLVVQRAEAAGMFGATVHFRRMAVLLGIGLVHAFLIWDGDILVLYAGVGTLAFAFVECRLRTLVATGVGLIGLQMLILAFFLGQFGALRDAAIAPNAAAETVSAWVALNDLVGIPSPAAIARELAVHRDGYSNVLGERLSGGLSTPFLQYLDAGAETLGLMLLGMAALKSGFVTGGWPRGTYLRIAATCYLVGLPATAWIAFDIAQGGFDPVTTIRASELTAAPFRTLLMIGHASLFLWWIGRAPLSWLGRRVAAVGRMALSNYVGTSLAMTLLFYGYGGGLFGRLGRAELYLVVPVVWLAMLAWSKPWLDRFHYGPLEWLWRSLSRGQRQPMRRLTKSVATVSQ